MRIGIIGSNGQVASEVALHLSTRPDVDLVPLARSRGGSAFLRYQGISCLHGSMTHSSAVKSALRKCDVIANFALAGGTPSAALKANEDILRGVFECCGSSTKVVFFSTLAVHGEYDSTGKRTLTAYGKLKLRNERLFATLAKRAGCAAYILRLGHVVGTYQNISLTLRTEISSPPIVLIDPDRVSNVTHTVTIADALLAIGAGRAGPAGRYDLVNIPQWTWRQVYENEAARMKLPLPLDFRILPPSQPTRRGPMAVVFQAIRWLGVRDRLTRLVARMPGAINEYAKAEYSVNRARNEIAALVTLPTLRNPAAVWPAIATRPLAGLTPTAELFATNAFPADRRPSVRWAPDLDSTEAEQGRSSS